MKNFGSVNIVYDISNLIVQNQTVEGSEHKRYNKIVHFVTTNLVKKNSNQSVKFKSFINSKPISIKSLDSCNAFLHDNSCKQLYFELICSLLSSPIFSARYCYQTYK